MAYRGARKSRGRTRRRYRRPRVRKGKRRARTGNKRGRSSIQRTIREITDVATPFNFGYEFGYRPNSATYGKSLFFMICQFNDSVDIAAMHNQMQTYLAGPTSANNPLSKLVTWAFKGMYTIKLANNLDTFIDVYKVVARRDLDSNIAPLRQYPALGVFYADVWDTLFNGYNEVTNSPGALAIGDVDKWPASISPFNIPRFTQYFKILKKKTFRITGAGYKNITVTSKKKKLWNGEMINGCNPNTVSRPYTQFKNRTITYFGIARTQPVVDSVNINNVSLGTPSLLMSAQESYKYTAVANAMPRLQPVTTSYGAVTTARTMLAETELASNYVAL